MPRWNAHVAWSGVTVALVSSSAPLGAVQAVPDELRSRIVATMEAANWPGLAVGVVRHDTVLYAEGFGVADRASGRPVTPETLFQIGSTSKSFTATLLALLVDRGAIDFDDPLAMHLPPDVRVPGPLSDAITIRHLATHTSGLPRQPPTLRRIHGDAPVLAFTHFELYQSITRARLAAAPGSRFAYSNFGYAVLGHALERASGKPYETLLVDELFEPLEMRWSTVTIWPQHEPLLARPYYPNTRTGELEDYTPWDTEAFAPAGGIASSVVDLAKYVSYQLRAPGLLNELRERATRFSDTLAYGMGWLILDRRDVGRVINHGGEVDGYTSFLAFAPDRGVGVILLTNTGDAALDELGYWIMSQVAAGTAE